MTVKLESNMHVGPVNIFLNFNIVRSIRAKPKEHKSHNQSVMLHTNCAKQNDFSPLLGELFWRNMETYICKIYLIHTHLSIATKTGQIHKYYAFILVARKFYLSELPQMTAHAQL